MNTSSSPHVLRPGEGRVLKLGAPMTGEVTLTQDPQHAGGQFTAAIQTLQPGCAIPPHRYLFLDRMVYIHKGQGRIHVGTHSMTVVPGSMLTIPHNIWFSLRNNGTGRLEIAWACAPAGIDAFFQELANHTEPIDTNALQTIGQRFGIEFLAEHEVAEAPAASGPGPSHGRRRRRGGRNRGHRPPQPHTPLTTQAEAAQEAGAVQATAAPAESIAKPETPKPEAAPRPAGSRPPRSGRPFRGRHRGGRGGDRGPAVTGKEPGAQLKLNTEGSSEQPKSGDRVREVYMGGRWVQVTGDGPVVYPGKHYFRKPRKDHDDDSPSGPLSVIP